jgi:Ca2+-binding RTX toxin-like protein
MFNITSTISGSTTVNGGAGNDTFTIGNASHKLDDIQGNLTVNGNTNDAAPVIGDRLIFDDSGQTTGFKYTLTDTTMTRTGLAAMTFGTMETLELNSGSANDKFVVNFSSYPHTPAQKVKFNFGEALHASKDDLQINGTAGNDRILVGTTNSSLGEEFLLNDIDCLQMFGNAGNDVLVNDTDVSSLIDGGTGSDVLLGGSNVDVIFGGSQLAGQHDKDLLYGRGGSDFLFADYDYNAGQPKVLHQTKNGDQAFGDDAPSAAVAAQYGLPSFTAGTPGMDTIVVIGSDSVSAGGQVGDTIIGSGFQQLTVVDWLRASFLKPTSKNIQKAINDAKQVECFKTTF